MTATVLLGRGRECRALDELLDAARTGQSRALVMRGDAGVGKSALLDYVRARATGCDVARAVGVQAESELAFAGLHQLCVPLLDRLERLPAPQRDALSTAFGLRAGLPPDRFFVGLAVLSLLSAAAEERPLVCLVDDAQWLDRASTQVLALVARRLASESVALIFALRGYREERELADLPELWVEGLDEDHARALLGSVVVGPVDARIRDRIIAETGGNPLALLELPRGLTSAELAGGFGLPDPTALEGRIEESFRRRLQALPPDTLRLLLVAAAEPVGDAVLLWRAAGRLGIGAEAAEPAEAAGLIALGARVWFHHPLVRSAVYRAASPAERQSVHRLLAEVTDPETDPDRRAWHRAAATTGPDDDVADELERSASRARARGGLAAAAAFLERSAALTRDPRLRPERLLAAAQAKYQAGALEAARALLASAESGRLDDLQRAEAERLQAQIAFALSQGRDVPPLLLKAAQRLEPLDASRARETYLDALAAAIFVGHLAGGAGAPHVAAAAARAAPPAADPSRAPDLLLDGLALLFTDGYVASVPTLKRALSAFRSEELAPADALRWLWLAGYVATFLWDDESWHALSARQLRLARGAGALSVLPMALAAEIGVQVHAGDLATAASLIEELETLTEAIGLPLTPYGALALAAWRGREAPARRLMDAITAEVTARSEGMGLNVVHWAKAVLYNGLGRYGDALEAALRGSATGEFGPAVGALLEVIEAAVRSGTREPAADALARLTEMTQASGTDWALGIEAGARALLSEGTQAEALYQEAIQRLGRARVRPILARTHLVYGEWLRRERRRTDAREQLRIAHEMLTTMGIEAFAERAARELLATGETARRRSVETRGELTAQEAQIARLAREGLSNTEIGARLFISPRTVQYHLGKVFAKLDINSRAQLEHALGGEPTAA